jgi:RNA polymerase sigma-70 factor (ECF subfamily)
MSETSRTGSDWGALELLFPRYLSGDSGATSVLFTGIMGALRGYFHVRMGRGPDAEDLLQATLLKIHFARDRFDRTKSLKTWVFTIASRSLIDHWRGNAQDDLVFEASIEETDLRLDLAPADILSPEEKTLLHRDLNQALEKLKPMERSIVYLYGVEGLSMAEIGQTLLITEGAAKLRAHRAYQELRKLYGRD